MGDFNRGGLDVLEFLTLRASSNDTINHLLWGAGFTDGRLAEHISGELPARDRWHYLLRRINDVYPSGMLRLAVAAARRFDRQMAAIGPWLAFEIEAEGRDVDSAWAEPARILLDPPPRHHDHHFTGRRFVGHVLENRFTLLDVAGHGGFSTVYRARDAEAEGGTPFVAVKVLHEHWAIYGDAVSRFEQSTESLARLSHSAHVVRLIDPTPPVVKFDPTIKHYYFVRSYIEGLDLQQWLVVKPRPFDLITQVIRDALVGLSDAHAYRLIHRDIKPSNILMDRSSHVWLADFDLVLDDADRARSTRSGHVGTFVYGAPETMINARDATFASDVYSMGMVALRCLYGEALLPRVLESPRDAIVDELDAPEAIKRVVRRAIETDQRDRFADAPTFLDAWREAVDRATKPLKIAVKPDTDSLVLTLDHGVDICLRHVPGGTFVTAEAADGSGPVDDNSAREITLGPFWLAEVPVSVGTWKAVMSWSPELPDWGYSAQLQSELPMHGVSWLDAVRFVNALSHRFGRAPYYSLRTDERRVAEDPTADGFRLPTSAEWEFAARDVCGDESGSTPLLDRAWYRANAARRPQPVGRLRPNGFGIYDLFGNVWEWMGDRATDPNFRMIRGGSYRSVADELQLSSWDYMQPSIRDVGFGFRIVWRGPS